MNRKCESIDWSEQNYTTIFILETGIDGSIKRVISNKVKHGEDFNSWIDYNSSIQLMLWKFVKDSSDNMFAITVICDNSLVE